MMMRVTIRYSLDQDTDNKLRRYVEGRLNLMPAIRLKAGTATFESYVPMTNLPEFGDEVGAIFRHLHEQAVGGARLDHFWMHCDVVDDRQPVLADV